MSCKRNSKKPKPNKASPPTQSVSVTTPNNLTAEEMQHIIANAIVEAGDIQHQRVQAQKERKLQEWHSSIGYKDYSDAERFKRLKQFLNNIRVFLKISFLPKEKIEGSRASSVLLTMFLSMFFDVIKWCLLLLSIGLVLVVPSQYILSWYQIAPCILYGFLAFLFSRMFRMASIEIEKIEDRTYIFGLFTSVTSIVSILIAVVATIKGR